MDWGECGNCGDECLLFDVVCCVQCSIGGYIFGVECVLFDGCDINWVKYMDDWGWVCYMDDFVLLCLQLCMSWLDMLLLCGDNF